MCNRCLQQTSSSLSSREAEFYAASACAGGLLGLTELIKELHYNASVRLDMDSDSALHMSQRRGLGEGLHEIRCSAVQQWIREKLLLVRRVDTKDNTADLFTKHLDGPTTRSLSTWTTSNGRHGRLRACEQRFQCGYSQFQQVTDCTQRGHLPLYTNVVVFFSFFSLFTDRHRSVVH